MQLQIDKEIKTTIKIAEKKCHKKLVLAISKFSK